MPKTVTLIVPSEDAADYPISVGTTEYKPYRENVKDQESRWLVDMPAHHAAHFIHNGGFLPMPEETEDQDLPVVPAGVALVRHVGFDGKSPDPRATPSNSEPGPVYTDETGRPHKTYMVPVEAVDGLVSSHGFKIVDSMAADGHAAYGAEMQTRFNEMQGKIDYLNTQIEPLQTENANLRDALGKAEAERDAHAARVAELEAALAERANQPEAEEKPATARATGRTSSEKPS